MYSEWDTDFYKRITKHRCIQVVDDPCVEYVDYHKVILQREQEKTNGAYLVDFIVEKASFPNGRWKIPDGVDVIV